MGNVFDPSHKERLESPNRRAKLDVDKVLSQLPLTEDQVVADIGCGTGYFAIPLAARLTQGSVICTDVSEDMLDTVRQKVAGVEIGNVELRKVAPDETGLEPDSIDGALMSTVLHEVDDRESYLRQIARALRLNGWFAVIEFVKRPTEIGPPVEQRLRPEEVIDIGRAAGLASVGKPVELSDTFYMIMFRPLETV